MRQAKIGVVGVDDLLALGVSLAGQLSVGGVSVVDGSVLGIGGAGQIFAVRRRNTMWKAGPSILLSAQHSLNELLSSQRNLKVLHWHMLYDGNWFSM